MYGRGRRHAFQVMCEKQMLKMIVVRAGYDDDAKVWHVEHSDLQGVHVEGDTLDELRDKLPNVVRDLIEENGESLTDDITIEIVAHTSTRIAA
jgi:predicted RNase H-like HicB family nuclease